MSADHAVFPIAECSRLGFYSEDPELPPHAPCSADPRSETRCDGCLGDGRRVLLDQPVPVEERGEWDPCCADGAYGPCDCTTGSKRTWVEVES